MDVFAWFHNLISTIIENTSLSDTPIIRTIIIGILVTVGLLALAIMWLIINPTGTSLFL